MTVYFAGSNERVGKGFPTNTLKVRSVRKAVGKCFQPVQMNSGRKGGRKVFPAVPDVVGNIIPPFIRGDVSYRLLGHGRKEMYSHD